MPHTGRYSYNAVMLAIKSTLSNDESLVGLNKKVWNNLVWDIVVEDDYVQLDTCFDSYEIDDPISYLFGSTENYDFWRRSILGLKLNGWRYEVKINDSTTTTDIVIKVSTAITLDIGRMHKVIKSELPANEILVVPDVYTIQYRSPRSESSQHTLQEHVCTTFG